MHSNIQSKEERPGHPIQLREPIPRSLFLTSTGYNWMCAKMKKVLFVHPKKRKVSEIWRARDRRMSRACCSYHHVRRGWKAVFLQSFYRSVCYNV